MKKKIFLLIFLFRVVGHAQSINGLSGLINIPSARILNDNKIALGASYIPKDFFIGTGGVYRGKFDNPGLNTYATFSVLPFVEIMFRYTHEINAIVTTETKYFPDRMISAKIRILNEKNFLPSVVIGFEDMGKLLLPNLETANNSFRSASYLVLSKYIGLGNFNVDFTFGYAFKLGNNFDYFKDVGIEYKYLKGNFNGISIEFTKLKGIKLLAEYDSSNFNLGYDFNFSENLNSKFFLIDLKKIGWSINLIF